MMSESSQIRSIENVENFFMSNLEKLFDDSRYEDAEAFAQEYIVNGENPDNWLFLDYLADVR